MGRTGNLGGPETGWEGERGLLMVYIFWSITLTTEGPGLELGVDMVSYTCFHVQIDIGEPLCRILYLLANNHC